MQTPLFITQAKFTEVFTHKTPQLSSQLQTLSGVILTKQDVLSDKEAEVISSSLNLVDRIKKDAERYRTKQEVADLLTKIKNEIDGAESGDEFSDLYDLEISFVSDIEDIPKKNTIGEWLEKHPNNYFAEIETEQEPYQARVSSIFSALDPFLAPRYETRYRRKISGFELTDEMPFHYIQFIAKPKYANIPWGNCTCVLILSKTAIRFFYFYAEYKEINWDGRKLNEDFAWKSYELTYTQNEKILAFIIGVKKAFKTWVLDAVGKRFPQATEETNPPDQT